MTRILEPARRRYATLVASTLLFSMFGCSQSPAPESSEQPATPATAEPAGAGSAPSRSTQLAPAEVATEAPVTPIESKVTEAASPAPAKLTIGSVAPPLAISNWVQGAPFEQFKPGHVYVVEFWATWCPPCRTSMPHLASMQEKYADQVTFLGITSESEEVVNSFLDQVQDEETGATWREVASYSLALDTSLATSTAYMIASGQKGIPAAFIVGLDQHIEWIGHPMELDGPVEQIVAGTWDRQRYLVMSQVMDGLREALAKGDWNEAIRVADQLMADYPDYYNPLIKFSILLQAKRYQEALAMAEEMARDHWEQADRLNEIAWNFAAFDPIPEFDYSAVLRIAERANELREGKDPSALDTIARIYFVQGDLDAAVAWQQKAVDLVADNPQGLDQKLAYYLQLRDQQQQDLKSQVESPAENGENGDDAAVGEKSPEVPPEPDGT
jgi:thiol-disulfide isomerase/thioredoxin